jgi:hypothetical protein
MRYTQIVLLEYDRSKTAAAYGERLLAVAVTDKWFVQQYNNALPGGNIKEIAKTNPEKVLDYLLTWIERGDPTPNKEYSQSIAKMYSNGLSKLEDITSTLADYLVKFDRLKRRKKILPPRNDFNRYRDLESFYDVVDEYPDEEEAKPSEVKQNVKELYRDSKLIVTIPQDVEAACYYGQGTRWCTAGKNNNMYNYYTQGNKPLYIIIPRQPAYPNEKYQFHFESKQFMNEQDHQIGAEGMAKLVQRFPELPKILQIPAEKYNVGALIGDEYRQIVRDFTPEAQQRLTKMIEEYADRIVAFGFKSLKEYGIELPSDREQAIAGSMRDYFAQCIQAMNSKGGIWERLSSGQEAGLERNEDKIETMLSNDAGLQQIATNSPAGRELEDALIKSPSHVLNTRVHRDAIPHIKDLVLRDPLFRFCMKQIPKMYTAKLQEQGHALQ